jgi:hypothetical protein
MAIIKFLPDESGEKPAFIFLDELRKKVKNDLSNGRFFAFIMLGLEHLENCKPFPIGTEEPYTTNIELDLMDGTNHVRKIELVKPLAVPPILEMRVDWYGIGCFRSMFFPYEHREENYYCFVKAFIKTTHPPYDPTNIMRDETYRVSQNLRLNPEIL